MSETSDQTATLLRRQLAALDKAMASGVLTVEGPDTGRVTYRSYAEMRAARSDLLQRIREAEATATGVMPRRRARRIVLIGASGL
jgi:hypothetical protein